MIVCLVLLKKREMGLPKVGDLLSQKGLMPVYLCFDGVVFRCSNDDQFSKFNHWSPSSIVSAMFLQGCQPVTTINLSLFLNETLSLWLPNHVVFLLR